MPDLRVEVILVTTTTSTVFTRENVANKAVKGGPTCISAKGAPNYEMDSPIAPIPTHFGIKI